MKTHLIWSHEHAAWWAKDRLGYSKSIGSAGRYSREEAMEICDRATLLWSATPNEVPVRIEDLPEAARSVLKE